ncbi:MAG TPA: glycosyltransferase [Actinocrinis sp.]|nr:glycosyltransferase [Actinocrinis sp.]
MSTLLTVLAVPAWLTLAIWLFLLVGRGLFWRMGIRLPWADASGTGPAGGWPSVTAVVPARDEAAMLPDTLPALLAQDYPGPLSIIVVDDGSSDGTGQVARQLADEHAEHAEQVVRTSARGGSAVDSGEHTGQPTVTVLRTEGPPPGWAGKVAAMDRGAQEAGACDYLLFTDSDIAHPADSVRRLVGHAEARHLDLTSLMARLNVGSAAERAIVPAFVFSFFQLYPPTWVNRPGSRTAAAAGGCMLVRRDALDRAGGLAGIAAARIDDVALGTLLKRAGGRIWLGTTASVRSLRPYPRLADLWDMIARSAYTQLRYSPWLLAGTMVGLTVIYVVPPVLGAAGLVTALASTGGAAHGHAARALWQIAAPCLAAWAVMSACYLPVLRLYRLRAWRAPLLPGVMAVYAAMTLDSARRHRQGRGGSWKGRVIEQEN